jgi:L-serine kinase (ADP)
MEHLMNEIVTILGLSRHAISLIPIARLLPHEQHDPERAAGFADTIQARGIWTAPLLVERRHAIILDGHHRFNAAKQLGLAQIPAVLISYDDPRLSLTSWRAGEDWSPEDVVARALEGRLCPPKSTRHTLHPSIEEIALLLVHLRPGPLWSSLP